MSPDKSFYREVITDDNYPTPRQWGEYEDLSSGDTGQRRSQKDTGDRPRERPERPTTD